MASNTRELMEFLPLEVMIFRERILTFKQLEDERIHKSWARFNELINQCPNHDIPDIALLDCFYRSLGPGNKRLVDQLIPGGIAKQPYVIAAQLLSKMVETNQEVEKDFMLAALMAQMDQLAKKMAKIEIQCKRQDKYIPPHERRSLKENEVKCLKGMLLIILHKVTEQDRELKGMKEDIEGMKRMIWSHSRAVQLLENLMGYASHDLHPQQNRGLPTNEPLIADSSRRFTDGTISSPTSESYYGKIIADMAIPKVIRSNKLTQSKKKGITINEDATASKSKVTQRFDTGRKGKGKHKTVELLDTSSDSAGFYTNDPTTYDSESMSSGEDELREVQRNELRSKQINDPSRIKNP
uniref:Uncharacterized protein n=1 Tax=Solanum tuberosum TaxID=4113 RepID=M1DIJ2_SOLTU